MHTTPVDGSTSGDGDVNKLWRDAAELAAALTRYVTKDGANGLGGKAKPKTVSSAQGRCNDDCDEGACGGLKLDSPTSPDVSEHGDREWRSDVSESDSRDKPYEPQVSSISSEVVGEQKVQKNIDSVVEGHKGYWQDQSKVRRVAHVRPRSRGNREWINRRRTYHPMVFRMSSHAPVIQTREVVTRVTQEDGTVLEESLQNRFVLARTVATQTRDYMFEENEVPMISFENIMVPEVEVVIDLTQDSEGEGGEVSSGTPVLDERK